MLQGIICLAAAALFVWGGFDSLDMMDPHQRLVNVFGLALGGGLIIGAELVRRFYRRG